MIRIGQGFDVHQLVPERQLVIGGVTIPYAKGLIGLTDGDVLTHSIIDGILGGAGLGDIGQVYPPESDLVINGDSLAILQDLQQRITDMGFTISQIDCTILAEKPTLSPYLREMKQRLSSVCQMSMTDINLKATTLEGLGFIGREEGIGAMALVLLEK